MILVFECGNLYPERVGLAGYRVQDSYSVERNKDYIAASRAMSFFTPLASKARAM